MDYYGLGNLNEGSGINPAALVPRAKTNYADPAVYAAGKKYTSTPNQGRSWWDNLFGGSKSPVSNQAGVGTYATFTGSDGAKVGLSKEAYDAAISNGHVDGLTKGFDAGEQGSGLGNFLKSDTLKGLGTIAGIGTDVWGILNQKKALKQAEKQWEAENARANEIMAMNREKYDTFKADKARLNSQYTV